MHQDFSNKFRNLDRLPDRLTQVSKEKFTGEEFCIETQDWKKAEEKGPKNTTAGPDEIPISLINQVGPQGKAQLISAIGQVIRRKSLRICAKAG